MVQVGLPICQTVYDKVALGVIIFDEQNWQMEAVNPHGRILLRIPPEADTLSLTAKDILASEAKEGLKRPDLDILQQNGFYADILLQAVDGSKIVTNCWVHDVEADGQRKIMLFFQDMTLFKKSQRDLEIKREGLTTAYQELLKQHEELLILDRAKAKFIALISHELRTPISAMVTSSEMLVAQIYRNEEQREQLSRTLYDQAHTLMSYINAILDFTRLDANKMDYFIGQHDPQAVLQRQMENFSDAAHKAGAELVFQAGAKSHLCYFDDIRLSQVVGNILNNAIKFIGTGSLIELRLKENDDFVVIEIQDDGIGIDPSDAHKVFLEFEIIGETRTHQKGTGLGMPIAKRIMTDMGGKLSFVSEKGKGTTFFIEIPKKKVLDGEDWYRERPELGDDLMA